MNRFRLERNYRERGLDDYKLRNLEDLFYIYSVKMNQVQGYSRLSDEDKSLFNCFVINYFNNHGLDSRDIAILNVVKYGRNLKVGFLHNGEWNLKNLH